MPSCFLCLNNFDSQSHLLRHITLFHSFVNITEYKCLEDNCFRIFSSFNSFRKHLKTHANFEEIISDNVIPTDFINDINIEQISCTNENCTSKNCEHETNHSEISIDSFHEIVTGDAVNIMAKWYNEAVVPRNKVQSFINDIKLINLNSMQLLQNTVLNQLKTSQCDSNSISKISVMFEILKDPFKNLDTEYLRINALEKLGVYIKPSEITVGSRIKNIVKDGNTIINTVKINVYFISLRSVFKAFFEQPNVLQIVLNYFEKLNSMKGDIICSYIQCEVWKEKCCQNPNKLLIPFFLYFDDYETNNPLGSHAGKKKIGAVYVSFGSCIPLEFSSSLNYIFLALLFNSNDRKEVGNKNIFKELISEINFLQTNGVNIEIQNKNYTIHFYLALILGDNLGIHSILGFSESFMARYPCRFCKCSKVECNNLVTQENSKLRNRENYSEDLITDNLTLTGIKEACVWNAVNDFHATINYSVDIMHDVLEGVCLYDIAGILFEFIIHLKYFSLVTLNDRIKYFNYGPIDTQNKPQPITNDFLKEKKLKMSASEMLCFSRHFGVMIGDLVPNNSELWQLYILLKKIIDIVISKSIQTECIFLLKTLITEHNQLYIKIFQTNLKPKHHHLIHYPYIMEKVGPLAHLWSMRYESKHRESKLTANSTSSRKNICYTLSVKHQLRFAYRLLSKSNILAYTLDVGKIIELSDIALENMKTKINNTSIDLDSARFVTWVNVKGTRYTIKNMIIILNVEDMPKFAKIVHIFFIIGCDIPFLIGQNYITVSHNEHLQAYEVEYCSDLICISFNDIIDSSSCVLNTKSNNCSYISCNL